MEFRSVRGFHDILPEEIAYWQRLESFSRRILEAHGFKELRLPVLEMASLFKRGIGEETDIVSKEMYLFSDPKGRELCLRPEATSQIVRAYIQNRMDLKEPISKLYLIGPMFRHERPQKGRYRQFHQIDVELIGDRGPISDAEILILLWRILQGLGMGDLVLTINSLGCEVCRPHFKSHLKEFLRDKREGLCPDCQRRSEKNPLRVFDCKEAQCKASLEGAPRIDESWCGDCTDHLRAILDLLSEAGIPYILDSRLMRGLDYYTRTAFEVKTKALGAQDAVAGGGRYDRLISTLGGPDRPSIGFAIGMERAIELLKLNEALRPEGPKVFIASLGFRARLFAFKLMMELRARELKTEMAYGESSLKSQMRQATRYRAEYVLIIGDEELEAGTVTLKEMNSGEQTQVKISDLIRRLIGPKTP